MCLWLGGWFGGLVTNVKEILCMYVRMWLKKSYKTSVKKMSNIKWSTYIAISLKSNMKVASSVNCVLVNYMRL